MAEVTRPRGRARLGHVSGRARRVLRTRGDVLLVIAAGGALGSLARWGLALALPHRPGTFPWATFCANVSGSFLIGALLVALTRVSPAPRYRRPFLGVGVLGGYTTFSTYVLDARGLLVGGRPELAGAYLAGSLAGGLAAVTAGALLTRALLRIGGRPA